MPLIDEQRQRKYEMAKLNRAKKKEAPIIEYECDSDSDGVVQVDVEDDVREAGKVEVEDPEIVRKRAIADKRRE